MTSDKRRYWGFVTADVPAAAVAAQAKMQEDAGLEGLMAAQLYSTPFIPLAAAATVTSRVRLLSGIALAFTRSPYETAVAAMDMDRISGGRFILGLGCSVRATCSPHTVPSPAPSWASETVMQCMTLIP